MKDLIILLAPAVPPFAARAVDVTGEGKADRGDHALAGRSMGGGQPLNFGPGNLDPFARIGDFPSASDTEPPVQLVPDLDAATKELKFLDASTHDEPGLIRASQGVHAHLKECRVPHFRPVDEPDRDYDRGEISFHHFTQLIFQANAK